MPRYLVERTFPDGLHIPIARDGMATVRGIVSRNRESGVTWLHSYVSDDKRSCFCLYEGPSPEAIRQAADSNDLPIDKITKVNVLDPYFYS